MGNLNPITQPEAQRGVALLTHQETVLAALLAAHDALKLPLHPETLSGARLIKGAAWSVERALKLTGVL